MIYWIWLSLALGIGTKSSNKLLYKFSPERAYNASRSELVEAGLGEALADRLSDKSLDRARRIIAACEKKKIEIITLDSQRYPRALKRLDDQPLVLYARGDISCIEGKKIAGFVGTRRTSQIGVENGIRIANELIDDGYLLVSGIAEGIDTIAARQSLARGVLSVAVLGVDIDKYFPSVNRELIDRVAENGVVISEYPPGTNARFFTTRNRIIAGLSDIFNVIEAPLGSGALIGARVAMKIKVPTFAFVLESEKFDGCRQLIQEGARALGGSVVEKAEPRIKRNKKSSGDGEIPEDIVGLRRYIWEKLLLSPQSDNSLIDKEHPASEILCALTELELDGHIRLLPNGKYALK